MTYGLPLSYAPGFTLRGTSGVFLPHLIHQTETVVQYQPLTSERWNSEGRAGSDHPVS